jgi:glycine cleavage system H lipoate-binding protein
MAWVGPLSRRAVTVGASEFALDFAGKIAAIELPPSGVRLREGHPAVTLVSKRGRRLSLPAPVAGRVLAVNPHPAADAKGWLLRVRPRPDGPVETLLQGNAAKHWIEEARALVLSRLEPAVGRMAQDGGVSQRAWGELLDDRTWTEIKNELFPESPAPMAREGTRPTRMEARR